MDKRLLPSPKYILYRSLFPDASTVTAHSSLAYQMALRDFPEHFNLARLAEVFTAFLAEPEAKALEVGKVRSVWSC